MLGLRVVSLEVITRDMSSDRLFPLVLTIGQEPLIAKSDNASLTSTCGDLLLRLVVRHGGTLTDHLLLDDRLGIFDSLAGGITNLHDSLRESFLVALVLALLKLYCVFIGSNFSFLTSELGTNVAHAWNVDNGDWVKAFNPLEFDAHDLTETRLVLEILKHLVIVGCV